VEKRKERDRERPQTREGEENRVKQKKIVQKTKKQKRR
jgi:hypothetical protein